MRAANGAAGVPIVVVGRIDAAGAVEVEVVGVAAVRVWSRRPVVAVVTGVSEQVAGILIDVAAPNRKVYLRRVTHADASVSIRRRLCSGLAMTRQKCLSRFFCR